MRVLQINKYYPFEGLNTQTGKPSRHYSYGGSEAVMLATARLLERHGHEVRFFCMKHPDDIDSEFNNYFLPYMGFEKVSFAEKLKMAANILYSFGAKRLLSRLLDDYPVDIAHLHNFHHQISPSILFELKRRNIPVVMSIHDYKMVCPSYNMLKYRDICGLCKGKNFYNCATTRCCKNSFQKSFLLAVESYFHHNILHSYKDIKYYICPSRFMLHMLSEMGLEGNLVHLPHFIDLSIFKPRIDEAKDIKNGVYWGRLSVEKGLETLVEAAKGLPVDITIIGDGPLRKKLEKRIKDEDIKNIRLLGSMYGKELLAAISKNAFSIVPSEWYEVFGLVILEAFGLEMPVIGARIGAIPEFVKDGQTGFLFEPCDVRNLKSKILDLISEPSRAFQMGKNGRQIAERDHNPELYYERLIEIYNKAIDH